MAKTMAEVLEKSEAPLHNVELSEKYISKILEAHSALLKLVPFNTSSQVQEAAPWWQVLYDVLAFTSVDSATESFVSISISTWFRNCTR